MVPNDSETSLFQFLNISSKKLSIAENIKKKQKK